MYHVSYVKNCVIILVITFCFSHHYHINPRILSANFHSMSREVSYLQVQVGSRIIGYSPEYIPRVWILESRLGHAVSSNVLEPVCKCFAIFLCHPNNIWIIEPLCSCQWAISRRLNFIILAKP